MPRSQGNSPFLEQVGNAIRVRHYSIRTEEAYVGWIKRFILFHGKRHPKDMGEPEVVSFLTKLAVQGRVAAATQNQALNALVFLYKIVLERPLGEIQGAVRAKKPQRLPVVLTTDEVSAVLHHLSGTHWLVACLLYGSGLRLMEAIRLRVKDLDFDHRAILVRHGKGAKDRVVTLPDGLMAPLKKHLEHVRMLHDKDLVNGFGAVYLPYALERKYPNAPREWHWQYLFPSGKRSEHGAVVRGMQEWNDGLGATRMRTNPAKMRRKLCEAATKGSRDSDTERRGTLQPWIDPCAVSVTMEA